MPGSKDVGSNIEELRKRNKGKSKPRSEAQIKAIALSQARSAGNRSVKPPPGKRE